MKNTIHRNFVILVALLALGACDQRPQTNDAPTEGRAVAAAAPGMEVPPVPPAGTSPYAIQLVYAEEEPGVEPYVTTMVINRDYLHIDDEEGKNNFVLFDRKLKIVYSVAEANGAILEVNPKESNSMPPSGKEYIEERVRDDEAPRVDGKQTVHYRYSVGGEVCLDTVVVKGLLDEAVEALKEYRLVLAKEHKNVMEYTPIDTQHPCDLAIHVYEPILHLQNGLPIRIWDYRGRKRTLLDYNDSLVVNSDKFQLPDDFARFTLEEYRQGVTR